MYGYRGVEYGYAPHAGFGLLGGLFGLLFIALVVFAVLVAIRHGKRGSKCGGGWCHRADSATTLLRERYAKGEISKEEFEEKQKVLSN